MNDAPTHIQGLYPTLTEADQAEAEHRLDRYLSLVLRIFERIDEGELSTGSPLLPDSRTLRSVPHERPELCD